MGECLPSKTKKDRVMTEENRAPSDYGKQICSLPVFGCIAIAIG